MNAAEIATIATMRARGCAVTVFMPEELNGADPSRVEDRLVELGWDVIETLAPAAVR